MVRAQVRLSAELLRTRFGKPIAFADSDVVVLDPAVGTGTYPLAVLDQAERDARERLGRGAVGGKMRDLAARLNGFEILVGPYAVAHLRLSQRLRAADVADAPARVFLTDTLESPHHLPDFTVSLLQERIAQERRRAQEIKKDTRVFVCIGNPPYDRDLRDPLEMDPRRRKGGWVRYGDSERAEPPIFEDFVAPVRDAGGGVHLKTIYNDYVYFWRWALWKVFDSTGEGGIVSFITAASYLSGPGFAGMRRKMRETFDELWIVDLEGDSIGARKTNNVFSIRIPVAIAVGVRRGEPRPNEAARVWKIRLVGTAEEKLKALDDIASLADADWIECLREWDAPFHAVGNCAYFDLPAITDLFPWQHSGIELKRTWPIAETSNLLSDRWFALLELSDRQRRTAFRETPDRKIDRSYPLLIGDRADRDRSILEVERGSPVPPIARYAFRSFDRQWVIADSRVGSRMRPELWRAHGQKQMYLTGILTDVPSSGAALTASTAVPDRHHFRGRGGKDVIPMWRDANATQPNITRSLLDALSAEYGAPVSCERLFAYVYGALANPAYVQRFWDELEQPPPRVPITKDAELFERVADHGARLLYLHTYCERFGGAGDDGYMPQGAARCVSSVSQDEYPVAFDYDADTRTLSVGDGRFAPVSPEVWGYSVSGLQVVKSWLDYRKLKRAGRKSSPLDDIRPARWDFTEELLDLLWLLEATVELEPLGASLLEEALASPLFSQAELPKPSANERKPLGAAPLI